VSVRLREEVQALLRRSGNELSYDWTTCGWLHNQPCWLDSRKSRSRRLLRSGKLNSARTVAILLAPHSDLGGFNEACCALELGPTAPRQGSSPTVFERLSGGILVHPVWVRQKEGESAGRNQIRHVPAGSSLCQAIAVIFEYCGLRIGKAVQICAQAVTSSEPQGRGLANRSKARLGAFGLLFDIHPVPLGILHFNPRDGMHLPNSRPLLPDDIEMLGCTRG